MKLARFPIFVALSIAILVLGCDNQSDVETVSQEGSPTTTSDTADEESSSGDSESKPVETPETRWERGERTTNNAPTEGEFKVKFVTSKGDFVMHVHRDWAPRGAERFYRLIKNHYYDGAPFYRVVVGFMVQFGMNGDPKGTSYWDRNIPDDPVLKSNKPGMVTYAKTNSPNSRSTQLFINYGENKFLDGQGFAPFAEITQGMDVVEGINAEYEERPSQQMMSMYGNQYVFKNFPNIDYIISADFIDDDAELDSDKGTDGKTDNNTADQKSDPPTSQAETAKKTQTIEFPSADGLTITGDLYLIDQDKSKPFIVLCHQAGWSRGEYLEIAPKLNTMGFNCLAIDQRSGKSVNDIDNETVQKAEAKELGTDFPDAEQDMISAVKHVRENYASGKILLWGSSYSSALALRIAGEKPDLVDGVLAFAPGEYFKRFGKPEDWIASSASKIKVPVFITSAKDEKKNWADILEAIPGDDKISFVPETTGNHGSRALWEKFDDHPAYWKALIPFLIQFLK